MIPDLSSVLFNWTGDTQMKVIKTSAVDFEVSRTTQVVLNFEALLTAMSPQKIIRKPEGDRSWMWWTCITTKRLELQDEVMDDQNRIFKVDDRKDWGKAGFYEYDLVEQPVGLSNVNDPNNTND